MTEKTKVQNAQRVFKELMDPEGERLHDDRRRYLDSLWKAAPEVHHILKSSESMDEAREGLYCWLGEIERRLYDRQSPLIPLEKLTIRDCTRIVRNILAPLSEERAEFSALSALWTIARSETDEIPEEVESGFIIEFIFLFLGVSGQAGIYLDYPAEIPSDIDFLSMEGRAAARKRTDLLDEMAATMKRYLDRYPSGLNSVVKERRLKNQQRIMDQLGATEEDWADHRWQLQHVFKSLDGLNELIELSDDEQASIRLATDNQIPFGITPYYLSLMDRERDLGYDEAVRAMVIPPLEYTSHMVAHRGDKTMTYDFMGEHDSSPVDLITRRYPCIAILKPFNTCSQICVYCQRNWEIDECMAPHARSSDADMDRALAWLRGHPAIGEVLVTGGDPMVMADASIKRLLDRLAAIPHIYRIRIGTRTPVVLPQRWSYGLADLLGQYHEPGRREIAVVTHFTHPYEVTPEAMAAVGRIRRRGMGVYNQQVFSQFNSRRFETSKLRKCLRLIGVDPYYNFNMKGKQETKRYMVPIARILQETKEEARLMPGLDRTEEPVFNVPRLGKNHLRAWQDRRLIMILPDGRRIYEFHPWEKNIAPIPPFYYTDVSIFEYIQSLARRREEIWDYHTIWYYW